MADRYPAGCSHPSVRSPPACYGGASYQQLAPPLRKGLHDARRKKSCGASQSSCALRARFCGKSTLSTPLKSTFCGPSNVYAGKLLCPGSCDRRRASPDCRVIGTVSLRPVTYWPRYTNASPKASQRPICALPKRCLTSFRKRSVPTQRWYAAGRAAVTTIHDDSLDVGSFQPPPSVATPAG